jgi:two-component system chemotaxis sensor kinase CheA
MSELSNNESKSGGFDLTQFYSVFFEEAGENLANYESLLLNVDLGAPDDEEMNAIFRAAHSIKGGSATFGFTDVAELTHELETLLDRVRKHELNLTSAMVDTLLESGDVLKLQLARHQNSGEGPAIDDSKLKVALRELASGKQPEVAPAVVAQSATATPAVVTATARVAGVHSRVLELVVGPLKDASIAQSLTEPFKEIETLGTIERVEFEKGTEPGKDFVRFKVETNSPDTELLDLCNFYVAKEQIRIAQWKEAKPAKSDEIAGFGLFDDAPGTPGSVPPPTVAVAVAAVPAPALVKAEAPAPKREAKAGAANGLDAQTLRVSVEKVDQLINLVGELVITQAMLTQKVRDLDPVEHQQVCAGVTDLERNTRHLQDAVMSIRMIPMAVVFNRFPRMIRDLAAKLGKKVELVTSGEATELDKGLIEKITDPLTHLVRNSVDHGCETPDKRAAAGKPDTGTVTLSAFHQGGSIVIEVRDDGQGLRRDKILAKAEEKGIPVSDTMTDTEVWQLIFAPGFSTAEQVTDVSGRGVGMDVVKKNITALGGTVELQSEAGKGSRVTVRLPLTLAIMDGMSVAVGNEIYILPLASVVESLQMTKEQIRTIGNAGRVVKVRDEYLPVASLAHIFGAKSNVEKDGGILVVVEADGARTAVLVDELVGQHQVVVKNLESNYRKVGGISGATILGDGRVALILDVIGVAKRARH